MLILSSTGDKLQIVTGSAVTVDVHASWVDLSGTTVTPGRTNTAITTATTTDVVAPPGASTQRNVKTLHVRNKHASSSVAVTVQHTDGTTAVELFKYTLLAGEVLQYVEGQGFRVLDAAGAVKEVSVAGRLLRTVVLTSGTSHTVGPDTTKAFVRLVGGGGGGGGCSSAASAAAAGAGGGAGGYAEKLFAVTPGAAYTYAIGTAGTAGANTGGNGGNGGNSTFAVGGTTVTANGGTGGTGMVQGTAAAYAAGGAGGVVSTNGDLNGAGAPGLPGFRNSGTLATSGAGGSSIYGSGGVGRTANGAGNAGVGPGAGGGGGLVQNNSGAVTGGAGTAGVIIVEEYA